MKVDNYSSAYPLSPIEAEKALIHDILANPYFEFTGIVPDDFQYAAYRLIFSIWFQLKQQNLPRSFPDIIIALRAENINGRNGLEILGEIYVTEVGLQYSSDHIMRIVRDNALVRKVQRIAIAVL